MSDEIAPKPESPTAALTESLELFELELAQLEDASPELIAKVRDKLTEQQTVIVDRAIELVRTARRHDTLLRMLLLHMIRDLEGLELPSAKIPTSS